MEAEVCGVKNILKSIEAARSEACTHCFGTREALKKQLVICRENSSYTVY